MIETKKAIVNKTKINKICRREFINCRVTKLEKQKIRKRVKELGYNDLSDYVRKTLLS